MVCRPERDNTTVKMAMKMVTASVFGLLLLLHVTDAASKLNFKKVDKTIENNAAGDEVVDATVQKIQEPCLFDDDKLMLRRTAYAQSQDGATTISSGGIWQISEADFDSTKTDSSLNSQVNAAYGVDWANAKYTDMDQPLSSGIAARILMDKQLTTVPASCSEQKDSWNAVFNPSGTSAAYTAACSQDEQTCSAPKVDLLFVLDGSGSVTAPNFVKTKNFTAEVTTDFKIGEDAAHVGVIQFSSTSELVFGLNEYSTNEAVLNAIRGISYMTGGTNTADALLMMNETLFTQGRRGEGVPAVGVVVTDGKSNSKQATIEAATALHEQGDITIFAIGVGQLANLDKDELDVIGTDPDCRHVFLMDSFDAVLSSVSQMAQVTCKAPAQLEEGESSKTELGAGDKYYISMEVTEEKGGIEFGLDIETGDVEMYLSWDVVNPSSALHDYSVTIGSNAGESRFSIPYSDGVNSAMKRRKRRATGGSLTLYSTVVGGDKGATFGLSGAISGVRAQFSAIVLMVIALLGFIGV